MSDLHTTVACYIILHLIHAVPSYDPDSQFNITSLHKLEEEADIDILNRLDSIREQLISKIFTDEGAAKIFTDKIDASLDAIINQWNSGGSHRHSRPPAWRSLLDVLMELNMQDLSQPIENILYGK